ncbi:MAG: SRPBCC domain-containing protein [Acidimicrobiia bacterium]
MNTMRSYDFEGVVPAPPHDVWKAVTSPYVTSRLYFGMAATSSWRAGSPIVVEPAAGPSDAASSAAGRLSGEVLRAVPPRRLSFTLGAGDGQPATYVTWDISAGDGGSRVRLVVDEPAGGADEEGAQAWGTVFASLQAVLSGSPLR